MSSTSSDEIWQAVAEIAERLRVDTPATLQDLRRDAVMGKAAACGESGERFNHRYGPTDLRRWCLKHLREECSNYDELLSEIDSLFRGRRGVAKARDELLTAPFKSLVTSEYERLVTNCPGGEIPWEDPTVRRENKELNREAKRLFWKVDKQRRAESSARRQRRRETQVAGVQKALSESLGECRSRVQGRIWERADTRMVIRRRRGEAADLTWTAHSPDQLIEVLIASRSDGNLELSRARIRDVVDRLLDGQHEEVFSGRFVWREAKTE